MLQNNYQKNKKLITATNNNPMFEQEYKFGCWPQFL